MVTIGETETMAAAAKPRFDQIPGTAMVAHAKLCPPASCGVAPDRDTRNARRGGRAGSRPGTHRYRRGRGCPSPLWVICPDAAARMEGLTE